MFASGRREPAVRGFSLIELSMVITVLGILSYTLLYWGADNISGTKYNKAQYDIKMISDALRRYHYNYPYRRIVPVIELSPRFLAKLPCDPWGRDYRFNPVRSAIQCAGPDGNYDTNDDLLESYPTPRARVVKIKGTDGCNSILHIKIRGRIRTSAAPYHGRLKKSRKKAGSQINPVCFMSHFKSENDFYLNCGESYVTTQYGLPYNRKTAVFKLGDTYPIMNMGLYTDDVTKRDAIDGPDAWGQFECSYLFLPVRFLPAISNIFFGFQRYYSNSDAYSRLPQKYAYIGTLGPFGFAFFCTDCAELLPLVEIYSIHYWVFDDVITWARIEVPYYTSTISFTGIIRGHYRSTPEVIRFDDIEAFGRAAGSLENGVVQLW